MSHDPMIVKPSAKPGFWAEIDRLNALDAKAAKKAKPEPTPEPKRKPVKLTEAQRQAAKDERLAKRMEQARAAPPSRGVIEPVGTAAAPVVKEAASQHQGYMAIVRRFTCRRCGKPPPSEKKGNEFCHRDQGKGTGIKTDVREGWAGCPKCHKAVGEGKMLRPEKRRLNDEYAASTRAEVEAKGLWPKGLAKWKAKK